MRKIVVNEFVSMDGVIEAPGPAEDPQNGPPWWIRMHRSPETGAAVQKRLQTPFDALLGRKTFEQWASFWPQHSDIWPEINQATKYVASNTISSHQWQPSVFLNGEQIVEKITQIKQTPGPDLHVSGSANLVQTLLKHDLVDVLSLMILPVTLGGDKRLFADGTIQAAFRVTESTVTSNGVLIVTYERAREVPTGSL